MGSPVCDGKEDSRRRVTSRIPDGLRTCYGRLRGRSGEKWLGGALRARNGEREEKGGPLSWGAFRPHLAAVAADYALDVGEADAGPLVLLAVQSLEDLEQLVRVRHVESRTVVPHLVHVVFAGGRPGDGDDRRVGARGKLDRVGQQVREDLAKQQPVTTGDRQPLAREPDRGTGVGSKRLLERFFRKARHVDLGDAQFLPAQPRKREQALDEVAHVRGVLDDDVEEPCGLLIEAPAVVLDYYPRELLDRAQRRTQVVGDRVAEGLELPVQSLQFFFGPYPLGDIPGDVRKLYRASTLEPCRVRADLNPGRVSFFVHMLVELSLIHI